ncbi:MAG: tRNA-(ms[2]io[6]A)-hydroxylase, partial [Lentimonas sp.]
SEATHYTLFLKHARNYGNTKEVDKRWKEWIDYENEIIQNYGNSETIHG